MLNMLAGWVVGERNVLTGVGRWVRTCWKSVGLVRETF